MNNQDMQLMGFIAIALTAALTIYLTSIPPKPTQESTRLEYNYSQMAPAAGDVVPGGLGEIDSAPDTAQEAPLDKGEAYSVVRIYSAEQECKDATNRACHFVACKNAPVVGSEFEEKAIENVCEANEKSGWRAVVPAPDVTAVPEIVAPAL